MTPIFYFVQLYDWQCLLLRTLEGDQIQQGKGSWIYRFGDKRVPRYGFDIYMVTGDTGKDPSLGRALSTAWQTTGQIQPTVYFCQVLLKHSHAHSLIIVCGCFHTTATDLSSCEKPYGLRSLKYFTICSLKKKKKNFCYKEDIGQNHRNSQKLSGKR